MPTLDERWRALGSPWRPGMRHLPVQGTGIALPQWEAARCVAPGEWHTEWSGKTRDVAPNARADWTDPATLGALLGLVNERYSWEMIPYMDSKGDWGLRRAIPGYKPVVYAAHKTKAEALIAALEAHDGV